MRRSYPRRPPEWLSAVIIAGQIGASIALKLNVYAVMIYMPVWDWWLFWPEHRD